MNFGEGTSRNTRRSIFRDPEFVQAGNSRYSYIAVRKEPRIMPPVPSSRGRVRKNNKNRNVLPYQRVPPKASVQEPQKTELHTCPICTNNLFSNSEPVIKAVKCCGYVFCEPCITKCAEQFKACPMCNQKLTSNGLLFLRFQMET